MYDFFVIITFILCCFMIVFLIAHPGSIPYEKAFALFFIAVLTIICVVEIPLLFWGNWSIFPEGVRLGVDTSFRRFNLRRIIIPYSEIKDVYFDISDSEFNRIIINSDDIDKRDIQFIQNERNKSIILILNNKGIILLRCGDSEQGRKIKQYIEKRIIIIK
jgi:hypothetical protein